MKGQPKATDASSDGIGKEDGKKPSTKFDVSDNKLKSSAMKQVAKSYPEPEPASRERLAHTSRSSIQSLMAMITKVRTRRS